MFMNLSVISLLFEQLKEHRIPKICITNILHLYHKSPKLSGINCNIIVLRENCC